MGNFPIRTGGRPVAFAAVAAALLAPMPAMADVSYDACVRKLCVSTRQADCWIKAGAAICDRDQTQCRDVSDHTSAIVIRKSHGRWEVKTDFGQGWVSERMMMVSGEKC